LDSITSLGSLDNTTLAIVQDAFRRACMWSFISLLPWCAVTFIVMLGLRNIPEERLMGKASTVERGAGEMPAAAPLAYGNSGESEQTKTMRDPPKPRGPITVMIWPFWRGVQYMVNQEWKA